MIHEDWLSCDVIMYVIVAASVDANRILVDEERSILAARFFFIHQSPMIVLGNLLIKVVMISPVIPYVGMRIMLSGSAVAKVARVIFRFVLVWPWLLMRAPTLRLPNAEKR